VGEEGGGRREGEKDRAPDRGWTDLHDGGLVAAAVAVVGRAAKTSPRGTAGPRISAGRRRRGIWGKEDREALGD
jgi:hypothetical protein